MTQRELDEKDIIEVTPEEVKEESASPVPTITQMQNTVRDGLIAVEAGLFQHAIEEHGRLESLRNALSLIEKEILKEEFIKKLETKPQLMMKLHEAIQGSLAMSIKFLQDTHEMALKQHEVKALIESLERIGDSLEKPDTPTGVFDPELKSLIRKTIRDYYVKRSE